MGYGIALPKDSPYVEELTISIYNIRESGEVDAIGDRWISKTSICLDSSKGDISSTTVKIGVPSILGAFWILFVGCGTSFGIVILEWIVDIIYKKTGGKNVRIQKTLSLTFNYKALLIII